MQPAFPKKYLIKSEVGATFFAAYIFITNAIDQTIIVEIPSEQKSIRRQCF